MAGSANPLVKATSVRLPIHCRSQTAGCVGSASTVGTVTEATAVLDAEAGWLALHMRL